MHVRLLLVAVLSSTIAGLAVAQAPPATKAPPASTAPAGDAAPPLALDDLTARFSYALGLDMGRTYKKRELAINLDAFVRGVQDGESGGKALLTDEEIREVAEELNKEMSARRTAKAAKNIEEGKAFLAANGKKQGVVTLPSGLQYKIVKAGTGKKPKATDMVKTHYHGTFLDGTVFDSSVERKEPVTFPVNMVIKGWSEALQLMPVGSKWQLFVPSDLAYGPDGTPNGDIPPNSTLVFEVELLNIENAAK